MSKRDIDRTIFGRVAVLMGGHSPEREISLDSGNCVCQALLQAGVDAHAVDVSTDLCQQLKQGAYDRAFVVLHGSAGEDGRVQALLEWLGLPYTGSAMLSSALSMDKVRSKWLWRGAGLPTPRWQLLARPACADLQMALPVVIKPVTGGSSLGISIVRHRDALAAAWQQAAAYGAVMAEDYISGDGYYAAILVQRALPLVRVVTRGHDFYDYEAKYHADSTQYFCPAGLSPVREAQCRRLARRAFRLLGCRGWGRLDMILDPQQNPWLLECNTIPGMTSHSLFPRAAAAAGIDFSDLVLRILTTTLEA